MKLQNNWAPVYLLGTDYEGDKREIWCDTIEQAKDIANKCSDNSDGFGWKAFEIWWNNPDKDGQWEMLP